MKKIFLTLIICIAITLTVVYCTRSEGVMSRIVKDIDVEDIKINDMEIANNTFYYNRLNDAQKKYYRVLANGIMKLNDTITVELTKESNYNLFKNDIEIALNAFLNDHPEVFFIGDKYEIRLISGVVFKIIQVKLYYTSNNKYEIQEMEQKLREQINIINSKISTAKSDYEKELIIHDCIAKNTNYYSYENYTDIPVIKHTAYGALVEKSAVCDGITKAFQLILDKNNIDSIFVTGETEDVAHAWCKVKIDSDYYNVDITSDKTLNSEDEKLIIHSYFNITDDEILKTHSIDKNEDLPKCIATKYNYFVYNNYVIDILDDFQYKLSKIVKSQSASPLLELMILGRTDTAGTLIQALYNINFNNYRTNHINKMSYSKINDNYIILK